MEAIQSRKHVVKLSELNMNLLLMVYFILAIEYDLYTHFKLGNIISGATMTFIEIIILLFIIFTTRRQVKGQYVVYGVLAVGILITYLFYPNCRIQLKELFFEGSVIKKLLLFPLAFQCVKSPHAFLKKLYILSIIEGMLHVICNAVWGYSYNEWGIFNYMTYGMALLTPTCIVMQRAFSKPSKISILFLCVFELNIIVYAHRGALLVTAVMMLIFFVKYVNARKKLLIGIFGVLAFALLYIFRGSMIRMLIDVMDRMGIESRTLEKLLSGDITNDSERNMIWAYMISRIMQSFPMGQGIGSDRVMLAAVMRSGLYAHNVILELCLDFGLIAGLVIVFWIIRMCYKTLRKVNDEWSELIIPFLIPSVVTLLTSSSVYEYYMFWVGVGLYSIYFGRKYDLRKRMQAKKTTRPLHAK